ncbi:hypothetical protein H4Q26_005357 [Puccinia striiformis f. sp. tritici PST-130]|nr:hypothetical protein H4Q26_005357 [Puccinia striiformis f. sp. tritici PST-130]
MNPGPVFPRPITTEEEMEAMINKTITPDDLGAKLNYVYEAIKLTTKALETNSLRLRRRSLDFVCIHDQWGGGSALNASKATSFDTAKGWIQVHPELSVRLLEKLARVCALHLVNQIKAGCQIVQVFDSWAGELNDYDFAHFSLPYLRMVSTLVKEELTQEHIPLVPMIVFAKGANLPHQLQQLSQAGYSGMSLDWKVQPAYAIEALGPASTKIALQGNLDPAILHTNHETIKKYVKLMFDKEAGGFLAHLPHIANLGHGITPGVDPEAMRTFLEAIHLESTKIRDLIFFHLLRLYSFENLSN